MDIYLPVAEMVVPFEAIAILGVAVGLLSSVFGVGGGFLSTPVLVFLGVPPSYAVGTQAVQLITSSLSGMLTYWRRGKVDFTIGTYMLAGSCGGTAGGVILFRILQHTGHIDIVINALYVLFLGLIGGMMLVESIKSLMNKKRPADDRVTTFWHRLTARLPYPVTFRQSGLTVSAIVPVVLGIIGGFMVSFLGMGGGFFLVPAMIYVLGMPGSLVVGTSLYQMFVTTILAAILHIITSNAVDLVLAFVLIIGSVVGGQIGIRIAKYIKGAFSRLLLSLILLAVCSALPATMPTGGYHARDSLSSGGEVMGQAAFSQIVTDYAHLHPVMYAFSGIFMAGLIGFLSYIISRRKLRW